jgi:hypothetical protein
VSRHFGTRVYFKLNPGPYRARMRKGSTMAITGIGVQVISARSGIGPQMPPAEPRNDNRRDDSDAGAQQQSGQAALPPGMGQHVDRTV